jgi:signal transduction histidine kinase
VNRATVSAAVAAGYVDPLVKAVRDWTATVRDRNGDLFELVDALPLLAEHESGRVRQAVAEATDLFSDTLFDHLVAMFEKDTDPYVRSAIERSAKRRATKRTSRARSDEQGQLLADVFDEAQKKHGASGRRLTQRAARRSAEYFVRRLHHEASKVIAPLDIALGRIADQARRPDFDRAALARDADAARERLAFLFKIVDRARDATRAVTPVLKDESLSALVREAHAHLVDRLGDRASCLDMMIDVAPSLRARVDRAAILQALQNLLQNGAEAHPASAARITISVTARTLRAGSQVEIVVRDGGEGMSDEQRATLFVPFGSSKPGGTGLGLVVVRSMIEEVHGGTMAIESARGEGTSVTMLLPTAGTAA